MRKAGEPNHFNNNLYNFSNKLSEFNFAFLFNYPSADEKR
jgi:hypothetical protein